MKKISRSHIQAINTIESNGQNHSIGDYRNINQHADIKLNYTFTWVGLNSNQILEPHWHTIDSFIYIYEGHGHSTGTTEIEIKAGNWIYIPAGCFHGFAPLKNGFKAIAFQYSPANFFEEEDQTHFSNDNKERPELKILDNYKQLIETCNSPMPKLTIKKLECGKEVSISTTGLSILFLIQDEVALIINKELLNFKVSESQDSFLFEDIV